MTYKMHPDTTDNAVNINNAMGSCHQIIIDTNLTNSRLI